MPNGTRIATEAEWERTTVKDLPDQAITEPEVFRKRVRLNLASAKRKDEAIRNEGLETERLIGENNMLPFYVLELGATLGRSVCKIETADGGSGSGFLVGADLLLTNHHVLASAADAAGAQCIFDHQLGPDRVRKPTVKFELDPQGLFITSPEVPDGGLDYTFVRITREASAKFGSVRLSRGSFSVQKNEYANIVHHPKGDLKRVTLQDNKIARENGVLIQYVADTEPGSSGSPVFNNDWQLIGLHHASEKLAENRYVNQGIKPSAIAADLERRSQEEGERSAAIEVLKCFNDTDSLLGGYFGGLGRPTESSNTSVEKVVDIYAGEAADVDVGFWNVEWFTNRWEEKLDPVARIVADLNLDVYALVEASPEATRRLCAYLAKEYGLDFAYDFSEPNSVEGKQSTTVIWNTKTVVGQRLDWPSSIAPLFDTDSRSFDELGLNTEAVHGKIFNRFPGLFHFKTVTSRASRPFDFYFVPLHLKAMSEGSLRRRMASIILGAAIRTMLSDPALPDEFPRDADWIIGGDLNAELATDDFAGLAKQGLVAISTADEDEGAMTYLKSPKSFIDHIFISPNLAKTYGVSDFFVYAADARTPEYIKTISDHRPVMMRLSLAAAQAPGPAGTEINPALRDYLNDLSGGARPARPG